jgi:hypothetical protein
VYLLSVSLSFLLLVQGQEKIRRIEFLSEYVYHDAEPEAIDPMDPIDIDIFPVVVVEPFGLG